MDDDELPLLLQMWDYTCSDEGFLLQNYGIEGVSYEVIDGTPTFTEVVTDGEIPAFSLAMNAYALGDTAVGIIDSTRQWVTYSDKQIETAAIWAENVDDDYALPDLMTLNTEETETFNTYFTDILTHVNTFTLSVIVGNTELNEDTWNDYLDALESMGLSTCIAQYQSAYDRYISK